MEKKPQHVGPTFGGKNFFPTHAPEPIVVLCRKINFKTSAVEKVFRMAVKARGALTDSTAKLFRQAPVLAVLPNAEPGKPHVSIPVCVHRGVFVNTSHTPLKPGAMRPRDARRAALKAKGEA